jgi:hypothetical protein
MTNGILILIATNIEQGLVQQYIVMMASLHPIYCDAYVFGKLRRVVLVISRKDGQA